TRRRSRQNRKLFLHGPLRASSRLFVNALQMRDPEIHKIPFDDQEYCLGTGCTDKFFVIA
ncbi:MAG TPA: hypothetical protein P5186_18595, partial [Candidatus Paceibacterota bacterium]|nr:hypothetical protein [Candidatus Paceibacterota bacterium]